MLNNRGTTKPGGTHYSVAKLPGINLTILQMKKDERFI